LLVEHIQRTEDDWGIEALYPPPDFRTHKEGQAYVGQLLERAIAES
jgi:hypothetical protein